MNDCKTGKFIQQLRSEKGITQKELAEALNCTDKAISRWETGKGLPDVAFLIPLSNFFEVSVNEILLGERIEKENPLPEADTVLVETLHQCKKKVNSADKIVLALFCIIQLLLFYGIPLLAKSGDEMGSVFFIIIATFVNSMGIGLIRPKPKFAFPLFCALAFIPTIITVNTNWVIEDWLLYIFVYFIVSLLGLLPTAGLRALVLALKKRKKSN